mgnify:CR=1 FL=1
MNYSKLAQIVQELEQNGFEEEATDLADAMHTEASPDVILSNSNIISELGQYAETPACLKKILQKC